MTLHRIAIVLALVVSVVCAYTDDEAIPFPENFLFGTSSSAFQIEGAWNETNKGESIWDHFVHTNPDIIRDHSDADMAADSYHLYERDVFVMKFVNSNAHRFSLSWPRLLPKGDLSEINDLAIIYYRNVIIALRNANIRPIVTLYHWDLPQTLQETLGGWENPELVKYYESYARFAFESFGDLVSDWVSFNEPEKFCLGYSGTFWAPQVDHPADGIYKCVHTMLLSHSNAYHIYHNEFCNDTTTCNLGIVLNLDWAEPKNSSNEEDQKASEDYLDFHYNLYAKPILSEDGDYPEVVRERAGNRLPTFTEEEKQKLIGSADFLGLNHYTTSLVSPDQSAPEPSFDRDCGVKLEKSDEWEGTNSDLFSVVPWGISKSLNFIHKTYPNTKIFITENGYAGGETLEDTDRIRFIIAYMREALKTSYESKIDLLGYLHWTAVDDFEWQSGYTLKFGLCHVNFTHYRRIRTLRDSATFYAQIGADKMVPSLKSINLTKTCERISF